MICARCQRHGTEWAHGIVFCKRCYVKLKKEGRLWAYACYHWCIEHGVPHNPDISTAKHGVKGTKEVKKS